MARKIMYIGNKPVKKDNILFTHRAWNGAGAVEEVKEEEAPQYLKHPDIFVDVTDLTESALEKAQAAARRKFAPPPTTSVPAELARSVEGRIKKIVAVFGQLTEDAGHFNKDGTPRKGVVEKMLDWKPDPEEYAFAWDAFKKAQASGTDANGSETADES